MARQIKILIGVALANLFAGCASNLPVTSSLAPGSMPSAPGGVATVGYKLTAEEQALECKQLTGRMQIRILEIRDYNARNKTTMASRALQSGSTAVFGGPKAGIDPDGTYAKDRATLEAYNTQLAAKGCRTYDLESELHPQDVHVTPNASIKPASKPDGKAAR